MHLARLAAFCTVLFILMSGLISVRAQPSTGQIGVTISNDNISIDMSLNLVENFTTLPSFNVHLDPSNSGNISQPMTSAMDRLVPSASINSLDMTGRTALLNNATNTWLLQENYTLRVSGVNKNIGSAVEADMSFLRMNLSQPVNVEGYEVNSLGAAYLLQPLLSLRAQQLAERIQTTAYFIDGHQFTNTIVPGNSTLTFNLLDFTWILPLVGWAHEDQPLASESNWTLPSSVVTPYNLTVGFRQFETLYVPVYEATYYASITITAPERSWAAGNVIMFDLPSSTETVMPVIAVAALVLLVVVSFMDRTITKPLRARRKR
jgi:hypothetical protein